MNEYKTSWEVREYVEEALTESQRKRDISWADVHFDKFGKEYDEVHKRDNQQWISKEQHEEEIKSLLAEINKHSSDSNHKSLHISQLQKRLEDMHKIYEIEKSMRENQDKNLFELQNNFQVCGRCGNKRHTPIISGSEGFICCDCLGFDLEKKFRDVEIPRIVNYHLTIARGTFDKRVQTFRKEFNKLKFNGSNAVLDLFNECFGDKGD